ncbi:MAG: MBL fold metallo-hydrolase [Chloroflexota bacterium]
MELAGADVLIIESTYGNRLHPDIREAEDRLAAIINETVKRGGRVIIPAFALGRTQDLLYTLSQLKVKGKIADIPVYVDSPLATNATEIFRKHLECFDAETRALCQTEDPFGFSRLRYIRSADESKKLNELQGSMIIIGGSGMAEAGRILHHLKNNIGDPHNTVLIVGWQADNTLGRKIQEGWESVPIYGERYKLRAQVAVFNEFSGHADKNDLVGWVSKGKWRKIFVVHGEEKASLSLAEALRETGYTDVVVPEVGEGFTL